MNLKEIQELLKQINRLELAEFKMKTKDVELSVRTKFFERTKQQLVTTNTIAAPAPVVQQAVAPANSAPTAPSNSPDLPPLKKETASSEANYLEIKSPIVGTFYRSSSPDKPALLKVGDDVKSGDVVCIVEAMKLFNEIESEISGKVVKVLVEDAQPVEYDQVLFLVDPNG